MRGDSFYLWELNEELDGRDGNCCAVLGMPSRPMMTQPAYLCWLSYNSLRYNKDVDYHL